MSAAKDEKPPTQRELLDKIAAHVAELYGDLDIRRSVKTNTAAPAPTEASTLGRCIAALNELREHERGRSRNDYGMTFGNQHYEPGYDSGDSVARILRHLAERFGVTLIERRTDPCSRKHLDSLDDFALRQAIEQATR